MKEEKEGKKKHIMPLVWLRCFWAVIFYGRAHQTHNDRVYFLKIMKSCVFLLPQTQLHFLFVVFCVHVIRFHQFSTSCVGLALHFVCGPPESAEYVTTGPTDRLKMTESHSFFFGFTGLEYFNDDVYFGSLVSFGVHDKWKKCIQKQRRRLKWPHISQLGNCFCFVERFFGEARNKERRCAFICFACDSPLSDVLHTERQLASLLGNVIGFSFCPTPQSPHNKSKSLIQSTQKLIFVSFYLSLSLP